MPNDNLPDLSSENNPVLPAEEIIKRPEIEVRILRDQRQVPELVMCKMPTPSKSLRFSASVRGEGQEIEIEGNISEE